MLPKIFCVMFWPFWKLPPILLLPPSRPSILLIVYRETAVPNFIYFSLLFHQCLQHLSKLVDVFGLLWSSFNCHTALWLFQLLNWTVSQSPKVVVFQLKQYFHLTKYESGGYRVRKICITNCWQFALLFSQSVGTMESIYKWLLKPLFMCEWVSECVCSQQRQQCVHICLVMPN
mgnify:CR=1 FL=1